jgi:XTP/dITP diphosphohydrolase
VVELVLATNNRDKVRELAHALLGLPLRPVSVGDLGDWPEVEETGATLAENALLKARETLRRVGRPCLADDTGLEVDALGGAPGVRSSRFAGENVTYRDNVEKLLREMAGVPESERGARFRCVIALADPDGREEMVEGVVEGTILNAPRGAGGFGYDPVFLVRETGRTFAEMSVAEKGVLSHRGRAMAAAREILARWYGLEGVRAGGQQ